jgi:glycosyltransferase involved in cell wall biosynthesis
LKKILLVAGSQLSGGAAKATINLFSEFAAEGYKVRLAHMDYSRKKDFEFAGSNFRYCHKILISLDRILLLYAFNRFKRYEIFSLAIKRNFRLERMMNDSDIIIINFFGMSIGSLSQLKKFKGKVYFVMRDDWFLTGGCHVINNCIQFKNECKSCPKTSFILRDYVKESRKRKRKLLEQDNFQLLTINKIHKEHIKDLNLITNTINKKFFDYPNETKLDYVVTSALNWKDHWKGYDMLVSLANSPLLKEICFVIIGKGAFQADFKQNNVKILGSVEEMPRYMNIVSRSRAFLFPSYMEPFGKVGCEAIALGTPVVSWGGTGSIQYLKHLVNSIIVSEYNLQEFTKGIQKALNKDWDYEAVAATVERNKSNLEEIKSIMNI